VPNPATWNHDFSSTMIVNDGHDSAWQYHQNNIATGAMYPNKNALKDAIIQWAMSTQGVFTAQVSSQKYLTTVCKNEDCPARVHGYLPKYGTSWVISDLVHHTCVILSIPQYHGQKRHVVEAAPGEECSRQRPFAPQPGSLESLELRESQTFAGVARDLEYILCAVHVNAADCRGFALKMSLGQSGYC